MTRQDNFGHFADAGFVVDQQNGLAVAARNHCVRLEGAGGVEGGFGRQKYFEAGVSRLAGDVDEPAVAFDDAGNSGKPEAGALANTFGGEEWIEDFIDDVARDAAAAVGNLQHDVRSGGRAGGYARVALVNVEILGAEA